MGLTKKQLAHLEKRLMDERARALASIDRVREGRRANSILTEAAIAAERKISVKAA